MRKVVFIAKTNLNNDGRILNQLKILKEYYGKNIIIDFILMQDKRLISSVVEVDNFYFIDTFFRNNRVFRIFAVLEFTFKALIKLIRLRPDIVHVQDSAVVLPVYLYRVYTGNRVQFIYDDHELPNENQNLFERIITYIENKLIKFCDVVVFANKERKDFWIGKFSIKPRFSTYFLNLPYYENKYSFNDLCGSELNHFNNIKLLKDSGKKIIIHQGALNDARGKGMLYSLIEKSSEEIVVVFLGSNLQQFEEVFSNMNRYLDKCYFVGSIQYNFLEIFWELGDASIVLYDPMYINNKLCAPNRYFLSFFKNIPIIVNKTNPVLNNLTVTLRSGLFIEDILEGKNSICDIFNHYIDQTICNELRDKQCQNFVRIYEKLNDLHTKNKE